MGTFQSLTVGTITHTGDRASSAGPQAMSRDVAGNILFATGTTVPADASAGYAVGCDFVKTNGGAGNPIKYTNLGSATSSKFRVSAPVYGWSIAQGAIDIPCTNGQTALPVATNYTGSLATDPAFMQFSTSDDGDYLVEAVTAANTITPELSADPLSAHKVQTAWLQQDVMPGWVCTHAGTIATVADAAGAATNDITVTGAAVGDLAFACFAGTDDTDQVGGAKISAANTLTVYLSANPGTSHTISYAVFAPVARKLPAYYIAYAGVHTTAGGAAAEAITVTGALATDVAIVTLNDKGSTPRLITKSVLTADTLTVTFADDPSTDHKVNYMILRAV